MATTLCINSYKPYTLAGFEPRIFCSVGGRDDHYDTPPGHLHKINKWLPQSQTVVQKLGLPTSVNIENLPVHSKQSPIGKRDFTDQCRKRRKRYEKKKK
jgi:hypothetical protein